MPHLAFVFVCLVWGSTFIFLERVTHAFGPVTIGIGRLLAGSAALGVIWFFKNRDFRLRRADWINILILALAFNSFPHVVMPYVLGNGFGHSFFGQMVAPVPLVTILVSIPMLGLWPTQRQLLGVLGGLACMWLIVDDGFDRGMGLGFLALAFIIPLTSAVGSTFIKWKLTHVPAVPLSAAFLGIAGLSLVPLEFFPETLAAWHLASPAAATPSLQAFALLMLLGALGTGISTAAFVWMIDKKGPLFAGMTTYVVPLLALLWGHFDHESISGRQLVAMAAIFSMVALVQFDPTRSRKRARPGADPLPSAVEPVIMIAGTTAAPLAVPASVTDVRDLPAPTTLAS